MNFDHRIALSKLGCDLLRVALADYHEQASKHYDPSFVPHPGSKNCHLEAMRLSALVLQECPDPNNCVIRTDDAMRRVIRDALQVYINKCQSGEIIGVNGDQVQALLDVIQSIEPATEAGIVARSDARCDA